MQGVRRSDITLGVDRAPKHKDVVLTVHKFPDQLSLCRVLVWEDAEETAPTELGETFAKDRSVVYAMPASRFKLADYGLSWVFEDDVEGAAAFKVSVALS